MNMIRVLHVVATMGYGGVSLMLNNYYKKIDKNKIQFDFISHGGKEDYHSEINAMGGKVFYVKTLGAVGIIKYINQIRNIIRENGPYDILHIHTNYQSGIVAIAGRLEGVKVRISHIRGTYLQSRKVKMMLPLFRALMKLNVTHFASCSLDAGRFYYGNRDFRVIPNAIELDKYLKVGEYQKESIKQVLGINDEIIIGHIGRFSKEKNHEFIIKLFNELIKENKDINFRLILVGNGDLFDEVQKLILKYKISDKVNLLGVRNDIPVILSIVDVLILPSISEGLPNVVIQAQSSGVPCVVSSNITKEVDMGLDLVKYIDISNRDIKNWCAAIEKAFKQRKIGLNVVTKKIRENGFDIETAVLDLESYYKQLLKQIL